MADVEPAPQNMADDRLEQAAIRLPETPILYTPPSTELIVVNRSRLTYALVAFLMMIGAYILGWTMATSSVATTVGGLPGSRANTTQAPAQQPFTRDPGQRFSAAGRDIDLAALISQVNPPEGFTLRAKFGKIGPQLITAGAIDYNRFVQLYDQAGQPLTEPQLAVLTKPSDLPITIDAHSAYFLLNFFWAVGLTNQNRILTNGPMVQYGKDQVGSFASTGGWTIGAKPTADLYSSAPLIVLTPEQQTRLETVAAAVFRPCCQNPTIFPDCNHGMAMLGLLELMAAQEATIDEMFAAAKQVNAFWFPQQTLEVALYFKADKGLDFAQVDPRQVVGMETFSASGYRNVHQWLANNGLIDQSGNGGSRCGV